MIGGLVLDALVLGAAFAFAWGAMQLGGLTMVGRFVETVFAALVAVLLRDPAGALVEEFIGTSEDFARIIGMGVVAVAAWIAANSVFRWWRNGRLEGVELDEFGNEPRDLLDAPIVARVLGGVLGLCWAVLFVALVVLQPVDSVFTRSAVDSRTGSVLIRHDQVLRWLRDGFPRYTQTLPKGKLGAVVGEKESLPMHEPVRPTERAGDQDELLRSINGLRRDKRARALAFNPDVAGVARRHALALAEDMTLSYTASGGATLDGKVLSALGESSGAFDEEIGVEVLWAHDPATAFNGLLDSSRAQSLLVEPRWREIGIGVADAGWFNGRIYVLLLVGIDEAAADDAEAEAEARAAAASGTVEADPEAVDPFTGEPVDPTEAATDCVVPAPTDLDGNGTPDEQSVDPALADCPPAVEDVDPQDPALQ